MVIVTQKQCLGHREEFNHIVFMCICIFTPLLDSIERNNANLLKIQSC